MQISQCLRAWVSFLSCFVWVQKVFGRGCYLNICFYLSAGLGIFMTQIFLYKIIYHQQHNICERYQLRGSFLKKVLSLTDYLIFSGFMLLVLNCTLCHYAFQRIILICLLHILKTSFVFLLLKKFQDQNFYSLSPVYLPSKRTVLRCSFHKLFLEVGLKRWSHRIESQFTIVPQCVISDCFLNR